MGLEEKNVQTSWLIQLETRNYQMMISKEKN